MHCIIKCFVHEQQVASLFFFYFYFRTKWQRDSKHLIISVSTLFPWRTQQTRHTQHLSEIDKIYAKFITICVKWYEHLIFFSYFRSLSLSPYLILLFPILSHLVHIYLIWNEFFRNVSPSRIFRMPIKQTIKCFLPFVSF